MTWKDLLQMYSGSANDNEELSGAEDGIGLNDEAPSIIPVAEIMEEAKDQVTE